MLKQIEVEKIKSWGEGFFNQEQKDSLCFDFESEIDKNISIGENKTILREKIRNLLGEFSEEQINHLKKSEAEIMPKEKYEELELAVFGLQEQTFKAEKPNKSIEEYYKPIEEIIEQMKMGLCHLAFIKGRAGVGKSEQICRYLGKYFSPEEIVQVTDISEAYLYRLFYEKNGCVFYFKDVDKLLSGQRSLLTLKTACETKPERMITNYNYKTDGLPKSFIFTGKLIFDYNEISNIANRESFEALISRGEFINLNFSFEEMCDIMLKLCDTSDKTSITEWLIENYKFVGFNQFNLRTQYRAFMWFRYASEKKIDWRGYIKQKLGVNRTPVQQLLYGFIGDKQIRTTELKKMLVRAGIVGTLRTADRRIGEWLELGELFRVSDGVRDFFVCLK